MALKLLSQAESQPLTHASPVPAEGHEHTFGSQSARDPALPAVLYSHRGPVLTYLVPPAQTPSLSLRGRASLSLRCCFWTVLGAGPLALAQPGPAPRNQNSIPRLTFPARRLLPRQCEQPLNLPNILSTVPQPLNIWSCSPT